MIKKNYKYLILLLVLLIPVLSLGGCKTDEEGLVAKVNGEGITEEEFEEDFQLYKLAYEKQYGEDIMSQVQENGKTFEEMLKLDIVEKLIIEKLIFQEAAEENITVTDEEVQEQIDNTIAEVGGQEEFEKHLEENNLTVEFLEENARREILLSKHGEALRKKIQVSDKEAKKFFENNSEDLVVVKASHILVETEEEGKDILKRLEDGEDFANIALLESKDSVSALNGGDLGYFSKGTWIAEFEDVAFDLKVGETSDLVKSEVGYHIIYLEDRKDTYESLEDDIKELIKQEKYTEGIYDLKNKAKIKIFLDVE